MKPDVAAPGVGVLSSLPASQGTFGLLSGTSMATPHVAGAAALLVERHPTWTVPQIKSALTQTGDPAHTIGELEALAVRGGWRNRRPPPRRRPARLRNPELAVVRQPRPGATRTRAVSLADAGGGAGDWSVATQVQGGAGSVSGPATVTVPGSLPLTATAGKAAGDVERLRRADARRRRATDPVLVRGRVPAARRAAPNADANRALFRARPRARRRGSPATATRQAAMTPIRGPSALPDPDHRSARELRRGDAQRARVPHVVFDGGGNRLAGYTGLPTDLNPYRNLFGRDVPVAGAVLPATGLYDFVFDTRSAAAAGPFTFRWWVNDVTPPSCASRPRPAASRSRHRCRLWSRPVVAIATLDGSAITPPFSHGAFHIRAAKGTHKLVLQVGDYQESKNMEDVPPILPNTATLRATGQRS